MTQEERWNIRYNEVKAFIETNHRNPSRHRIEEHDMLNWVKAESPCGWKVLRWIQGFRELRIHGMKLRSKELRIYGNKLRRKVLRRIYESKELRIYG